MKKILVVGADVELLRSRALILEKTGAITAYCTPDDFPGHRGEPGVGLVVLCHTLKPEERRVIVDMVGQQWPRARVLQVSHGYQDDLSGSRVDEWVLPWDPEKLLRRAKDLLSRGIS